MTPQAGGAALASLEAQWRALHAAADAVQALAGAESAGQAVPLDQLQHFPEAVVALSGGRRRLVEDGLSDLVAIMEPGLAALLSVQERGGNASVPARALWQEFASARDMLVAVAFDQTAWLAGDAGA